MICSFLLKRVLCYSLFADTVIFEDGTNVKIGTDLLNTENRVCETTTNNVPRLALFQTR
jgi:hypothetical protein